MPDLLTHQDIEELVCPFAQKSHSAKESLNAKSCICYVCGKINACHQSLINFYMHMPLLVSFMQVFHWSRPYNSMVGCKCWGSGTKIHKKGPEKSESVSPA